MKKIIRYGLLMLALGICATSLPARADDTQQGALAIPSSLAPPGASTDKPSLTPPDMIALTFYKLARQAPSFEEWARQSDPYKKATDFDRANVLDSEVEKMKQTYNMLSVHDPVAVEMQVKLSEYNASNQGYFIENFRNSTFFPTHYMDRSYALVPQGLVDKQWMKVDSTTSAQSLESAARASQGRMLDMVLLLTPQYADPNSAATIGGDTYWPIVVAVKRMMIYAPGSAELLWQSGDGDTADEKHQSIMNLYQ